MEYQITPPQWLQLSMPVRGRLVQIFNIPRSKGTVLEGNVVKSDGHTFDDLTAITVEGMQNYLGTDDHDFMTLFNKVIEGIEAELKIAEETEDFEPDPKDLLKKEWRATLLRIKGQSIEHDMDPDLADVIDEVFVKPTNKNANVKTKKRSTTTATEAN